VTVDANLSVTGTTTITTADINGGAIDGTTIGGSSAGAGTFSALTVNGSLGNLAVQSSGAELHFSRNENNDFLANGGTSASLTVGANNNLILKTGATLTERMRIDSSGNVGIGSSSPSGKLEVRTGAVSHILLARQEIRVSLTLQSPLLHHLPILELEHLANYNFWLGTTVGSIGTDGTTTYIAGASKALKLEATRFIPRD
jgi:hypothetical protein